MIEKLVWFIAVQLTLCKGGEIDLISKTETVTQVAPPISNGTNFQNASISSISGSNSNAEIVEIFHGVSNVTISNDTIADVNCWNSTSCTESIVNETLKTNYSLVAEAIASSPEVPPFRLPNSAAIAAGVCLVSGVIGYFSCVGYRRYLQKKYGDSEMLRPDDVYDTSDLKYFEI